ncbi:MAG: TIGR04076 family protein [Chloroflexi bacterium]|nr:TIGR04076 family protein [Chloroflexota bacterium]MBV9596955.1 TIGR04076 family protein [Chloroflexota bacterium]
MRYASVTDTFQLFDLRIVVEAIRGTCTCGHQVGDSFELQGGQLSLPGPNRSFCMYALQSALPLLPAKQRPLQPADWMQTDTRVVCPDPLCGVVMRIDRTTPRELHHGDVSAVPLPNPAGGGEQDVDASRAY